MRNKNFLPKETVLRIIDSPRTKGQMVAMIKVIPEVEAVEIPDNATNGEALCMLFPNMHYTLSDKSPRVVTSIGILSSFDIDWWNAPYKAESEK